MESLGHLVKELVLLKAGLQQMLQDGGQMGVRAASVCSAHILCQCELSCVGVLHTDVGRQKFGGKVFFLYLLFK